MQHSKPAITIDTAASLMRVSKRTLWRYLSEGRLSQQPKDDEGRAMVLIEEIAGQLCVELTPFASQSVSPDNDDYWLLALADRGDSAAQNDLALLCLEQERYDLALEYFNLAAAQNHADAMHHLSALYESGTGVEACADTALAWRSKAAAFGHPIARAQLDAL